MRRHLPLALAFIVGAAVCWVATRPKPAPPVARPADAATLAIDPKAPITVVRDGVDVATYKPHIATRGNERVFFSGPPEAGAPVTTIRFNDGAVQIGCTRLR